MVTIYGSDGTVKIEAPCGSNSTQVKELQGENVLNLSFTLYEHVALEVNDYADFLGERYWLMEQYRPEQASTVEWKYELKLYGVESLLGRFLVLHDTDGADEAVFTLTAPAREHVALIVEGINAGMGQGTKWETGVVDGGENIADGVVRSDGLHIGGGEGADGHRIEGEEDRGGDIVGGDKDGNAGLAGTSEEFLGKGQAGGQDDGADLVVDAELKNGSAILDQGDGVGGELGFEDLLKGRGGGTGHQDARLDHGIGIEGQERLRAEGASQEGNRGGDDGLAVGVGLVDNVLGEGVVGEEGTVTPVAADHGNGGKAVFVHELEGIPERGICGDGDGGAFLHAVGDLGEQVGDELRRLNTKAAQDVLRLRGQAAGTRRFNARPSLLTLELGVGDGRDDGIGVRIAVADDEGLAGMFAHGVQSLLKATMGLAAGAGGVWKQSPGSRARPHSHAATSMGLPPSGWTRSRRMAPSPERTTMPVLSAERTVPGARRSCSTVMGCAVAARTLSMRPASRVPSGI